MVQGTLRQSIPARRSRWLRYLALTVLVLAGSLPAACVNTDVQHGSEQAPAIAPAASRALEPERTRDLRVTVDEYRLAATDTVFTRDNAYQFVVENIGHETHAWHVLTESGDTLVAPDTTDQLASGSRQTRQVTFPAPGRYVFICSIPGHREKGMELAVRVN